MKIWRRDSELYSYLSRRSLASPRDLSIHLITDSYLSAHEY